MSTRTRALDAALDLVGTEGLRSLTHARVDERAGLPRGSTSNHFRTRAALLAGVVDHVAERELADLGVPSLPDSADALVDLLTGYLTYAVTANRTLTRARLVLFMEAAHNAELRDAVSRGRAAMSGLLVPLLTHLGAPAPEVAANAVMACCEGLILHRVAREDATDPRPVLALVVRASLS
ncbi:TetR/AcrR family transcriptional regulator [Hamadaea tsunoensis]|uniref:TetR/AcrR family transcriptional regulator n=1 Tax=Hamadaea tsunoensis TaxID=53368 RepID=UPI00040DCE46|nr:TetR family transcriptional regulator C-terminal domain-containing protein [Hamadaea tsunoensis]